MGISASLILSAVGAILIWAVDATSSGFNVHAAGVILLVVGIIGLVLSLIFWSSWGGFTHYTRTREVVREPAAPPTTTVIER